MVPLLLLLLLPNAVANQVCLNISNGNINIFGMNYSLIEERSGYVKCMDMHGNPCFFDCTVSDKTFFSGSPVCLEENVKEDPTSVLYSLNQRRICTIFSCQYKTILKWIDSLDRNSSFREMMYLFYMRDLCTHLFHSNNSIKKAFIKAERQIICNIKAMFQLKPGSSVSSSLKALSLNVVSISETHLISAGTNSRIQIEAPQLLHQNQSFVPEIWLPVDSLRAIPQHKRIIAVVSYMWHSQFQFEQENISSMVIRIMAEDPLQNLTTSIKMIFNVTDHTDMGNDSWLQCHYFDEHDDWRWKTDGCETSYRTSNSQTEIICNCNHATAFAVLLVRQPIAKIHWEILSSISYIGCGLSAFFSALSLVIYVYSRNYREDYSTSIHVSLSGALFVLNSTFLLTEWGVRVKSDWVCVFIAALMHYSLLCFFTWMAIEALHLYLLLIKVYNAHYKHYLIKLSLAGWGIPGVIVGVSLAVKDLKQFYGVTQLTMAYTNQTTAICWITDDSFFYSLNLVYFSLIFVFNSGILMAVTSSICRMKQAFRSNLKASAGTEGKTQRDLAVFTDSCRTLFTVLGLTCLMGSTWGLAFLGSGYTNYPILYLFCILNSLQGFFIFLWICLSAKKQRQRKMEDRMTSSTVKNSAMKSD